MHFVMMAIALAFAWYSRYRWVNSVGSWTERWQNTLLCFLVPPLLLLMTVVAILGMGPQGKMIGMQAGWFGYILAWGFILYTAIKGLKLAKEGWNSIHRVRAYPAINLNFKGKTARLLDSPIPYSAQIGFWKPSLVVSQGLLDTLDSDHLEAVLAHEQAHYDYRDTFWFFWLGWLRRLSAWLPNTDALWQELLMLRELRADAIAASQVDPLLLAESLLIVVSAPLGEDFSAAFSFSPTRSRLEERIDALLTQDAPVSKQRRWWAWSWAILAFLPLISIPFHSCGCW